MGLFKMRIVLVIWIPHKSQPEFSVKNIGRQPDVANLTFWSLNQAPAKITTPYLLGGFGIFSFKPYSLSTRANFMICNLWVQKARIAAPAIRVYIPRAPVILFSALATNGLLAILPPLVLSPLSELPIPIIWMTFSGLYADPGMS